MTRTEVAELRAFLVDQRDKHDRDVLTGRKPKQARAFSLGYALGLQQAIEALDRVQNGDSLQHVSGCR